MNQKDNPEERKPIFRNAVEFAEAHVAKNDHKCPFCGKEFLRTIVLKRHIMNHSGFKDYKCPHCPKTFVNKDFVYAHQKIHEKGSYPCKYCKKSFRNLDYALRHEKRHGRDNFFECDICGCKCISRDNIQGHFKNVHFCRETGKIMKKKLTCKYCTKIFWLKSKYQEHLKLHNKKPSMCYYCNKKISDRQNLKKHYRLIHPGKPILLPRFRKEKPSDTTAHKKIGIIWEEYHNKDAENSSVIEVIPHDFQTSWEFADVHVKDGDIQCKFCMKVFQRTPMLRKHMMKHSGINESKCPQCPKVFPHHDALHVHMLTHVKEEHPCKICGKIFQNSRYLMNHVGRVHANEDTHKCSICKSTFTRQEYLDDHVMTFHNSKTSQILKKIKEKIKIENLDVQEEEEDSAQEEAVPEESALEEAVVEEAVMEEASEIVLEIHDQENVYTLETIEDEAENADEEYWEISEVDIKAIEETELVYLQTDEQNEQEQQANPEITPDCSDFRTINTQADFLKTYFKEGDRVCSFCNKVFQHPYQLYQHILTHSGLKEFSCPKCTKCFFNEHYLKEHVKAVHTKAQRTCKQCGKEFRNIYYLRRHEIRHKNSVLRYECGICDHVTNCRDSLKLHLTSHYKEEHGSNERTKFVCKFCKKIFTNKRLYEKHEMQHKKQDVFLENEVAIEDIEIKQEKIFCIDGIVPHENPPEKLAESETIDEPPNPLNYDTAKEFVNAFMKRTDYNCYICGKVFSAHRHLKKHILSHEGVKDYKCRRINCSEIFDNPDALAQHITKMHSKHICNMCGKEFKHLTYLKRHFERHQSVKYECEICGRKYASRYILKCHFKSFHYDKKSGKICRKKFYCKYCDEYVGMESNYRKHMERHNKQLADGETGKVLNRMAKIVEGRSKYKSAKDFVKAYVNHGDRTCVFCGKTFRRHVLLKEHILNHYGLREFKCTKCHADFVNSSLLNIHYNLVHANESHPCDLCGKTFRNANYLYRHVRRHTLPRIYECELCGLKFTAFYTLKLHILGVHYKKETGTVSKKKYPCKKCKRSFWKKETLEGHKKMHVGKKPNAFSTQWIGKVCDDAAAKGGGATEGSHENSVVTKIPLPENHSFKTAAEFVEAYTKKSDRVCCFCERVFRVPALLRRHMIIHSGFREHKCHFPSCRKDFTHEDILQVHMKTVHAPDRYPCKTCVVTFKSMELLNQHLKHHKNHQPTVCKFCGKTFNSINSLRKHCQRNHKPQKDTDKIAKILCEICKQTFNEYAAYEKHKKVHMDKTCICIYCGKSIFNRANLRIHCRKLHGNLPIDKNDGPAVCTVCNALFEDLETLKVHFMAHGEYPFMCNTCGSSFKQQEEFRDHIQINHFDEDTYPCYMCGLVFDDHNSLKIHRSSHLKLAHLYTCDSCSKGFSTKILLVKHKEMHHLVVAPKS